MYTLVAGMLEGKNEEDAPRCNALIPRGNRLTGAILKDLVNKSYANLFNLTDVGEN